MKGWNGDPKFWSVQDGAITGKTTKENPTKGNTFIIWDGGKTGDFDLRLDYKIVGGNSGIQYRSFKLKNGADQWRIGGYQGDIDSGPDLFRHLLWRTIPWHPVVARQENHVDRGRRRQAEESRRGIRQGR